MSENTLRYYIHWRIDATNSYGVLYDQFPPNGTIPMLLHIHEDYDELLQYLRDNCPDYDGYLDEKPEQFGAEFEEHYEEDEADKVLTYEQLGDFEGLEVLV